MDAMFGTNMYGVSASNFLFLKPFKALHGLRFWIVSSNPCWHCIPHSVHVVHALHSLGLWRIPEWHPGLSFPYGEVQSRKSHLSLVHNQGAPKQIEPTEGFSSLATQYFHYQYGCQRDCCPRASLAAGAHIVVYLAYHALLDKIVNREGVESFCKRRNELWSFGHYNV